MKFVPAKSKTLTGRDRKGEPPTWAVVGVVASVALIFIVFQLADWFPGLFPNSTTFTVSLIFLPIVVMLALMIGTKMWEWRKAQSWSQTTGRIVKSAIETQRHRFQGEAETVKNVPAVEYEFSVGTTKVRGSRIAIGAAAASPLAMTTAAPIPRRHWRAIRSAARSRCSTIPTTRQTACSSAVDRNSQRRRMR
ncbi:MAG TPA: hypothetical protein VGM57_14980 [Pseudolabrys sp.]